MRPIKFRAWDIKAKKWLGEFALRGGTSLGIYELLEADNEERSIEWLQFTGLLDRHGTEIYEGDVVSVGMRRGDPNGWTKELVEWDSFRAGFKLFDVRTRSETMAMQFDPELLEILGNIYEHPSLLNEAGR